MILTGFSIGYGAVGYGAAMVYGPDGSAVIAVVAQTQQGATPFPKHEGRGYQGPQQRYRTEEEKRQRRIDLGILPVPVQKAVQKAVRRVINKAKAEERVEHASVNPLVWLNAHQANEQQALAHELRKRDLQFDIQYMALVRYEVERIMQLEQDDEDEQIVMLLMEI